MIAILRIGHRPFRDKRITTHVALVARAFGADKIFVDTRDTKLESTISSVVDRFGGDFKIETGIDWKKVIKTWNGVKIHLTMYGLPLDYVIPEIKKHREVLIIVGSEKVPAELFELADYNIAVGNQPHSEVAAVALFLDRYLEGKWAERVFDGKVKIVPSEKGKKVISK